MSESVAQRREPAGKFFLRRKIREKIAVLPTLSYERIKFSLKVGCMSQIKFSGPLTPKQIFYELVVKCLSES